VYNIFRKQDHRYVVAEILDKTAHALQSKCAVVFYCLLVHIMYIIHNKV